MGRAHRERSHRNPLDLGESTERQEGEQTRRPNGDAYHQYIMDMCDQVQQEVDYYLEHGKWPPDGFSSQPSDATPGHHDGNSGSAAQGATESPATDGNAGTDASAAQVSDGSIGMMAGASGANDSVGDTSPPDAESA